jgi:hypothetical protein
MNKTTSSTVAEYQLSTDFNEVRRKLLVLDDANRLEKPLAHWALPTDRHLPLVLLERTLGDLLSTPFEGLKAVGGVGPKKLRSMIGLLQRAAEHNHSVTDTIAACCPVRPAAESDAGSITINEEVWEQWRASILDCGLGHESVGRFAPTLQALPRAMWSTPLESYLGQSLAEIRKLKAHGAKRVASVVEIVGQLYALIGQGSRRPDLAVRIVPRFVERIECWAASRLRDRRPLQRNEILNSVMSPLVEQIRVDGGDQPVHVVEARLGSPQASAVEIARRLGLHRSHLYDRLAQVAAIAHVRWPEGREWTAALRGRLAAEQASATEIIDAQGQSAAARPNTAALGLCDAALGLFFPTSAADLHADSYSPLPVDLTWRSCSASARAL